MPESQQYLTVTALTQYIKRKFEVDPYLGRIYLTGEISNFRLRPNAHQYFSLKDDHAKINAIMFRSAFEKVKFTPEEGMKVLVVGRISLYEATGQYQIYVERMEPDGIGALYQAYEQLKAKLNEEGIFSAPKKPLVRFPKRIAVITSPSGAVIRDIITTVNRRYPIVQLVLFPAVVQGSQAAESLVKRLKQVNEIGKFDTIIIGRGGGSIEDLWPFNEENVARAIFDSQIPVISSVGHETDTTIADLVADVRAATPTAAAELATPVLSDAVIEIQRKRTQLSQIFLARLNAEKKRVAHLSESYVFLQPQRLYEGYAQKVDQDQQRLFTAMTNRYQKNNQTFLLLKQNLYHQIPTFKIKQTKVDLDRLKMRMNVAIQTYIKQQNYHLTQVTQSLELLNPLKIMGRGYTYVTDQNGNMLKNIQEYKQGEKIKLHVQGGVLDVTVDQINLDSEE